MAKVKTVKGPKFEAGSAIVAHDKFVAEGFLDIIGVYPRKDGEHVYECVILGADKRKTVCVFESMVRGVTPREVTQVVELRKSHKRNVRKAETEAAKIAATTPKAKKATKVSATPAPKVVKATKRVNPDKIPESLKESLKAQILAEMGLAKSKGATKATKRRAG